MNAVRSVSGNSFASKTFSPPPYTPSDLDNDWSLNDGITSNYFTLEWGVRQGGDLLAPYLYVVAVEILAIAIQQNI